MRLLGGIMMVSGCLGLGLWYRDQFIGRLRSLRDLTDMLEMLMSEIRYGKSALPECCRMLAGRTGEPYRSCLMGIYQKMRGQKGASFHKVFCADMEDCLSRLPLKQEDRQIFLQIFSEQGFQDGGMQLRCIEQGLEQLSQVIAGQEREQKEKCRMAVGLGAMSGLLLLIVLM